jgi:predicted protein tyrosine phosphatase
MKKSQYISSQAELEALIERYFEGMTSLEQEDAMRRCLAHCPWSSEAIDDARMVMGYFATHSRRQQRRADRGLRQRIIGIAATIAVILAVGGYALWHQQPSDVCIAYVNGKVVEDNDQVMALVANDMSKMDNAANAMTNQLSSLGEALELDNE